MIKCGHTNDAAMSKWGVNVNVLYLMWLTNEGLILSAFSISRHWAAAGEHPNPKQLTDLSNCTKPVLNWLICICILHEKKWQGKLMWQVRTGHLLQTKSLWYVFRCCWIQHCRPTPSHSLQLPGVFVQWRLCQMPEELTSHSWSRQDWDRQSCSKQEINTKTTISLNSVRWHRWFAPAKFDFFYLDLHGRLVLSDGWQLLYSYFGSVFVVNQYSYR